MSENKLTPRDVEYVAKLSRLGLSAEEKQHFFSQLGNILGYVEKLNELDTSAAAPMTHSVPLSNVYRPDQTAPSMDRARALDIAPAKDAQYYIVPKIIE